MKKLFLFLALLSASSALAQSAKVLVCAPGNLTAAKSTDSVLAKFYTDSIDVSDTITEAINNYEAVFTILSWGHPLTLQDASYLKLYLRSNKKLYVEYYPGLLGENELHLDSNGFWHFVGIDDVGIDAVNFGIQSVSGIAGTFTEGMDVKNRSYEPTDDNFGTWILAGKVKPVLRPAPDPSIDIAVTYETDSFKVVLHLPTIPDYYTEFLGRVMCNYFGLCAPLSVKPSEENPQTLFSLFPNPARDVLHIWSNTDNPGLQSAELISETGSLVSKFSLDGNMNHIDLDLGSKNLSSGNYFLRLNTERESFVKQVFLLTK